MTDFALSVRDRERNAVRSRELILDAAERLFADQGYEETSLSDVGRAAGLSRATPGYFFGAKADLHRAVLERCFEDVRRTVREGRDRALASGHPPDVVLAGAVSDYIDFVAARPQFVRLIQREALSGRTTLETFPLGLAVGREMISALTQELGLEDIEPGEVAHMLFSLIALSWFPHQSSTLARAMGIDTEAPDFPDERKRHVTELIAGWLAARRASIPSR